MSLIAIFANPWCLFTLLLVICAVMIVAALQSRDRELRAQTQRLVPSEARVRTVIASAPYEALLVIQTRLAERRRQLPPSAPDAQWLNMFAEQLEAVLDDVYWSIYQTEGTVRAAVIDHLNKQVAQLDRSVRALIATPQPQPDTYAAMQHALDQLRHTAQEGQVIEVEHPQGRSNG